jgi:hypothetical protein
VYVGQTQCFTILLLISGLVGMWRGWMREVITLAIVLGSVLFLLNGGNDLIYRFIFVKIPQAFTDLFFAPSQVGLGDPSMPTPNPAGTFFGLASFGGLTGLGYLVGHRHGGAPKRNMHRVVGFVPGVMNGMAMAYYATRTIFVSGPLPDSGLTQAYLPAILGLGLVAVFIVLLASK